MTSKKIDNMKSRFILLTSVTVAILISLPSFLLGQECQTSHKRAERIAQHPEIAIEMGRINEFTERWVVENRSSVQGRSSVILPVVVHIVWLENDENISDEQVASPISVRAQFISVPA